MRRRGSLIAGDQHSSVISGVAPGAVGAADGQPGQCRARGVVRRSGASGRGAKLGAMVAGDRYSIFVDAVRIGPRRSLALRDEQAPFRP